MYVCTWICPTPSLFKLTLIHFWHLVQTGDILLHSCELNKDSDLFVNTLQHSRWKFLPILLRHELKFQTSIFSTGWRWENFQCIEHILFIMEIHIVCGRKHSLHHNKSIVYELQFQIIEIIFLTDPLTLSWAVVALRNHLILNPDC